MAVFPIFRKIAIILDIMVLELTVTECPRVAFNIKSSSIKHPNSSQSLFL